MSIIINAWDDEEIKSLFKFVEIKRSEGMALIKIFDEFAKRVGRCQKSVRNFYYLEIKNLSNDKNRSKQLGIDLSKHVIKQANAFTAEESKAVMYKIENMVKEGSSVRNACLTLADGNISTMVRLQNKYRAELKKKQEKTKNQSKNNVTNIIKMPVKRNTINDEDIKLLFMGLVNLVKKQATEEAKEILQKELYHSNSKLKRAMDEIVMKSAQIQKLQEKLTLLEKKFTDYKNKEIENRVNMFKTSNAGSMIKKFIENRKNEQTLLDIYN